MRVTREQAEKNRLAVVEAASRSFRRSGFEGVGIVEIMKDAGLTHGGFYGCFRSKAQLASEASVQAFSEAHKTWTAVLETEQADPLAALEAFYLSEKHRDRPAEGCFMAGLAADAARAGPEVQAAFRAGVEGMAALLEQAGETRAQALFRLSAFVGALTLARAVGDAALSRALLDAAAEGLRRPVQAGDKDEAAAEP